MFNYYYQHEETQGDHIIDKFETEQILYILRQNNDEDGYQIEKVGTPGGIFKTGASVEFAKEYDDLASAKKDFDKLKEKNR